MTDDVAWALAQDVAAPAMEICLQAPYSILVISLDFGDRTCKLGIASGSDDQLRTLRGR